MNDPVLRIGPRVTALPVVHGSGDFAWEVRRVLMQNEFDCVAVPLPDSFADDVEAAVLDLPAPSLVIQRSGGRFDLNAGDNDDDQHNPGGGAQ